MNKENLKAHLKYVPHHKMGVKLLDESQLSNLLPNYESLIRRIEEHREQLTNVLGEKAFLKQQYNLMYDNIYAILGKRGAGKTSALFTLKKLLEDNKESDVVLPIIMPEMIPQGCNLMGWILALLEEKIELLNNELNKIQNMESTFFEECMHSSSKSLMREYQKIKELCFSQQFEINNLESFATTIINRERQTQNTFDFAKRLSMFWDTLKEAIKKVQETPGDQEPLIYIIFDDVDLIPEAVEKVLSTIIKYLSHPNIIVLITADEELLYEVIENNMNNKMGKHEELQTYSNVIRAFSEYPYNRSKLELPVEEIVNCKLNTAQGIPRLYVDKILPPSCRYYLNLFDTCEDKSKFIERIDVCDDKKVKITLEQFVDEEIKRYLKELGLNENNNFLIYKGQFIKAYLTFWGNTSRQLANEALILKEFIRRLIILNKEYNSGEYNKELYFKQFYFNINNFAYNSMIAMGMPEFTINNIKKLLSELIVCKKDKWIIYFNYSYLREYMENAKEKRETDLLLITRQIFSLLIMLFFLENIVILDGKSKPKLYNDLQRKVHGYGVLIDIIDQVTNGENSLVCRNHANDIGEFLFFYEKIIDSPELLFDFEVTKARKVRNYFSKLPLEETKEMVELEKYSRENPNWLKTLVKMLYFVKKGIYEIGEKQLVFPQMQKNTSVVYDCYYEYKISEIKMEQIKVLKDLVNNSKKKWNESLKDILAKNIVIEFSNERAKKEIIALKNEENHIEKLEQIFWGNYNRLIDGNKNYLGAFLYEKQDFILSEVQQIKEELDCEAEKLQEWYSGFKYYTVKDNKKVKEILRKLKWEVGVNIEITSKKLFDSDCEIYVIKRNEMDELMSLLIKKIVKVENTLNRRLTELIFEDNGFTGKSYELKEIYEQLINQLMIAIVNEEDIERSVNIIKTNYRLIFLSNYYLLSYLDSRMQMGDLRIETNEVPYVELYDEIEAKLNESDTDYISKLIRKHIGDGINEYMDSIIK